ncbi:MAG: hypothetical protein WAK17_15080 [Candidatus Nitrosopolaris sp.]
MINFPNHSLSSRVEIEIENETFDLLDMMRHFRTLESVMMGLAAVMLLTVTVLAVAADSGGTGDDRDDIALVLTKPPGRKVSPMESATVVIACTML